MIHRVPTGRETSGAARVLSTVNRAGLGSHRPAVREWRWKLLRLPALWRQRARVRRVWRDLAEREPDSVLADARISREDAAALGRRPFWRE
jgi:uncharacterized protein YjiS (DUF1127 family)